MTTITMKNDSLMKTFGIPDFNFEYLRHESGYPVYSAKYPLSVAELRGRLEGKMDASVVDLVVGIVENGAAGATELMVDGVETIAIMIMRQEYDCGMMIEHELVHCRQMEEGRLQFIAEGLALKVRWEGEDYDQPRLGAIHADGLEKSKFAGYTGESAFAVAQMILPWEAEAYELSRHSHPELSALADRIRGGQFSPMNEVMNVLKNAAIRNIKKLLRMA